MLARRRIERGHTLPSVGTVAATGIGALNEQPLHAGLKAAYSQPGDRLEAPVGPYIVDILRGALIIEIQTRNVAAVRRKLIALVEGHDVLLIVPIAIRTSVIRLGDGGIESASRLSPRRGAVTDAFDELVSIARLIGHPRFALELALVRVEEVRRPDARRGWRRHGWVTDHRRLAEVVEVVRIASARDLAALLPQGMPDEFTTADLASALGRPRPLAQRMAYCLAMSGAVRSVGKTGNAIRYVVAH
jgi:hypothetical protein